MATITNGHKFGGLKNFSHHSGDQKSKKSRSQQGCSLRRLCRMGGASAQLWRLHTVLGVPWFVDGGASLPSPPLSSSFSCEDSVIGFRAALIQEGLSQDPYLHLQRPFSK